MALMRTRHHRISNDMTIMYGNNAPGEGFRDVAVAVRGVGDCVLPWSCAEEQLE